MHMRGGGAYIHSELLNSITLQNFTYYDSMDCFFPHTLYVLYDVSLYLSICIFDSVSFISLVGLHSCTFTLFFSHSFAHSPPPRSLPTPTGPAGRGERGGLSEGGTGGRSVRGGGL